MQTSRKMKPLIVTAAATLLAAGVMLPRSAAAQDLSDEWRFRAFIYLWAPQIKGSATFSGGNTTDFDLKFHTIFDHLKMAGMGSIEAQKGRWGAFTDVIYMNVGATGTRTRDGTIDGVPLPVGVTAMATASRPFCAWPTMAKCPSALRSAESPCRTIA